MGICKSKLPNIVGAFREAENKLNSKDVDPGVENLLVKYQRALAETKAIINRILDN